VRNGLTAVVWEPWQLDELEAAARAVGAAPASVPVHLEIDTGMEPPGSTPQSAIPSAGALCSSSPLRLEAS